MHERSWSHRGARIGAAVVLATSAGCLEPGGRTDVVVVHPEAPPIAPFASCTVETARESASSAAHLPVCSDVTYPSPPTGGAHYAQWAAFGSYDAPVPWGFLVHAMEHGAIVLAYRCDAPADCVAIRAELEALVASRPRDPLCRDEAPLRYVLAPAPDLVEPIALLAWEHLYTATCLDRPSLEAFFEAHYARGPENTCALGVDLSATGWCP